MTDTRGGDGNRVDGDGHSVIGRSFRFVIVLPPAIADEAKNSKRGEGEVKDTLIQGLGGPFAQLLCRSGTDGTLGPARSRYGKKKAQDQYNQSVLFYNCFFIVRMIHNSGVESQKYDY
jgi:hypothetical protein